MTVTEIVQLLGLEPHPEGGFYKEVYRSDGFIEQSCLPDNFQGKGNFATSIYYLLEKGDFSAFHRIKSDETWHYYLGGSVLIHIIAENATFQLVIPKGTWFAAEPATDTEFTLSGCTVAPGFDFADFELADKIKLVEQFPQHQHLIRRLCR